MFSGISVTVDKVVTRCRRCNQCDSRQGGHSLPSVVFSGISVTVLTRWSLAAVGSVQWNQCDSRQGGHSLPSVVFSGISVTVDKVVTHCRR